MLIVIFVFIIVGLIAFAIPLNMYDTTTLAFSAIVGLTASVIVGFAIINTKLNRLLNQNLKNEKKEDDNEIQ